MLCLLSRLGHWGSGSSFPREAERLWLRFSGGGLVGVEHGTHNFLGLSLGHFRAGRWENPVPKGLGAPPYLGTSCLGQ